MAKDVISIRQLHQAEHGGKIVIQGGIAGPGAAVVQEEKVLSSLLGAQVVKGSDDKVQLRKGVYLPGIVRVRGGAAVLDAKAQAKPFLEGGTCGAVLLQGGAPVIVRGEAAVLPLTVIVVGDAELGESRLYRGLRHGGERGMSVGGEVGVGMVVDLIHHNNSDRHRGQEGSHWRKFEVYHRGVIRPMRTG